MCDESEFNSLSSTYITSKAYMNDLPLLKYKPKHITSFEFEKKIYSNGLAPNCKWLGVFNGQQLWERDFRENMEAE